MATNLNSRIAVGCLDRAVRSIPYSHHRKAESISIRPEGGDVNSTALVGIIGARNRSFVC